MTAALHITASCRSIPKLSASSHPPINFFYSHFHDSIRNELDVLSLSVSALASAAQEDIHESLSTLKGRYRFLEQVYKYHSSVEDEVRPVESLTYCNRMKSQSLRKSGLLLPPKQVGCCIHGMH